MAQRFAGAKVLAIDLSLASLGYAKRKAQELALTNIEFAQADILKLGQLGRSFDLDRIERRVAPSRRSVGGLACSAVAAAARWATCASASIASSGGQA